MQKLRRLQDFGGSGSPHISLRLNDRAGSPFCCSSCRSFERLKFLLFCRSVGVSVATARSCAAACGLRVWSIFVDAELCVRDVEHTRVARVVCFALSHKSEGCTSHHGFPLLYGMSGVCDLFRRRSNCFITKQCKEEHVSPVPLPLSNRQMISQHHFPLTKSVRNPARGSTLVLKFDS